MEEGTLIDWWIITRETLFILFYLAIVTVFLMGNSVQMYQATVLFVLYIVHIFLMKYSNKYEVAIKRAVANKLEINELQKIAHKEIHRFHINLHSKAVSIEMLNKVQFDILELPNAKGKLEEYIVFPNGIKKKLLPIVSVRLGEEQYAEPDDRALTARLNFKLAVTKVIKKLQAYKYNLQIIRTLHCRSYITECVPLLADSLDPDDDVTSFGESYYGEHDDDDFDEDENFLNSDDESDEDHDEPITDVVIPVKRGVHQNNVVNEAASEESDNFQNKGETS